MNSRKNILIYILVIGLLSLQLSCAKQSEKPDTESEDELQYTPPIIEEIEADIISIMSNLDIIPYYEKQIKERKKITEEKKKLMLLMNQNVQQSSNEGSNGNSDEGKAEGNQGENNVLDEVVKFIPKPISINDVVLLGVLKQEMNKEENEKEEEQIPEDIAQIWNDINDKIAGIHEKWNNIEPLIAKTIASQTSIKGFEDTLNEMTNSASEFKQIETLIVANILTSYIPDLVAGFKNKFPSSIYNMKFHDRQIVLDSVNGNHDKAKEHLDKIIFYGNSLNSTLIEEKKTELKDKLSSSITDLQNALDIKDNTIIKIKASILMKNLNTIKEELSK